MTISRTSSKKLRIRVYETIEIKGIGSEAHTSIFQVKESNIYGYVNGNPVSVVDPE